MTLLDIARNNVLRSWRDYALHFANSVFAVTAFFLFVCLALHPEMGRADAESTIGIISASSGALVAAFSLAFIAHSESCFLRARSRQFGLMAMSGASKKQLRRIVLAENVIIGLSAIVAGIVLGTAFLKLFLMAAGRAMGVVAFGFYLPVAPAIATVAAFLAVFFLSGLLGARGLSRKSVGELLDADRIAEGKPSVKAAVLTAVACAMLLVAGLAMGQGDASIVWSFALVLGGVGLLASGTFLAFYLCFAVGLSRRRSTGAHYEGLSMLKAAAFQESLKGNLQLMTVTAVLCSLSFFALVGLFTLSDGALEKTKEIVPYPVSYIARGDDVPVSDHVEMLESALAKKPGLVGSVFGFSWADDARNAVMSERSYNESVAVAGRNQISLDSGEALLLPGSKSFDPSGVPASVENALGDLDVMRGEGLVLLDGYASSVTVLDDADYEAAGFGGDETQVHAYTYEGWESDSELTAAIADIVDYAREGAVSLVLARGYYEADRVQFSLMLYLGSMLSVSFLLASASLAYSRLNARAFEEGVRMRPVVKLGLSRRGLEKVCRSASLRILAVPLAVALAYLWVGIAAVALSADVEIIGPGIGFTLVALVAGFVCCALATTSYASSVANAAFGAKAR